MLKGLFKVLLKHTGLVSSACESWSATVGNSNSMGSDGPF